MMCVTNDKICIQKIKERFFVWLNPAGAPDPKPARSDAKFLQHIDAMNYAQEWAAKTATVDGIVEIY
jgi:hypothetical protein